MLTALAIDGYRSLRNIVVPLGRLNVITGPNGSGKSSLYRAVRLLADAAQGSVIPSLAYEGGLQSTLWAGPETIARFVRQGEHPVQGTGRRKPVRLQLGFASDDYGYAIDLGLPLRTPSGYSAFDRDPEIKRECIWHGPRLRPSTMLVDRDGPVVRVRRADGSWDIAAKSLAPFDSMIAQLADPRNTPEVLELRDRIRAWRFYDHFRTDADAPARTPSVGTRTPVLSNDGKDLPAAIETIREIGDDQALSSVVQDAFPGSELHVVDNGGRFSLKMTQHGLLRQLDTSELSDGTLRYLLWIAVLLTPRPPSLMVLNEPETSLHPDLLPPLSRLIARAAEDSQIVVVSHSAPLIAALSEQSTHNLIRLGKHFGETVVVQTGETTDVPVWHWPAR